MARESGLWHWLSQARRYYGAALHMQRIENFLAAGTPDVEGFLKLPPSFTQIPGSKISLSAGTEIVEGQFWLELKSSERPARPETPIRFKLKDREEQIEFMRHRWELGANAFWLLQVGSGHSRQLLLAAGDLGAKLQRGLTESELMVECCHTGFFPKTISPKDILKRVVICRKLPSLMHR